MFLWAWGVNGCFSVIGAAVVPRSPRPTVSPPCWWWREAPTRGHPGLLRRCSPAAPGGAAVRRLGVAVWPAAGAARRRPRRRNAWRCCRSSSTPFPYDGPRPDGKPFLDVTSAPARPHPRRAAASTGNTRPTPTAASWSTCRGGCEEAAGDSWCYLHGNDALLERRAATARKVPLQLARSGLNAGAGGAAVRARRARLQRRAFLAARRVRARFLDRGDRPPANWLAIRSGAAPPRPVILVAYSGGYYLAAFALARGGGRPPRAGRVPARRAVRRGGPVRRLDRAPPPRRLLRQRLHRAGEAEQRGAAGPAAPARRGLRPRPPPRLGGGEIAFLPLDSDLVHEDLVTQAWTAQPLTDVLHRAALPPPRAPAKAGKAPQRRRSRQSAHGH